MEKNIRVLIIDDNEMMRDLLRLTLRTDGYDVVGAAADGATGLEMVAKFKPHLVCLDIDMPKISGINVLKMIKSKLPETAVLMISGKNETDVVKQALAEGASGFILKPFKIGPLLEKLDSITAKLRNT
jgi:two-component system chemotaxis response regulator CheY